MPEQIDPLTGIRGVAAAWVVTFHLQLLTPEIAIGGPVLDPVVLSGNLGVDLFFILSGFVISYTYLGRLSRPQPGAVSRFFLLRVARIYPAHLVTFLAAAVLIGLASLAGATFVFGDRYTPLTFVMNLAMMQAVPPAVAWNDPAWSISTEFAAYLAFPLLALVLPRLPKWLTLTLTGVLLATAVVGLSSLLATADQWPYWSGYALMWMRIALAFPLGCLLFLIWSWIPRDPGRRWGGWLVLGGTAGTIAACVLTPAGPVVTLPVAAYPFLCMAILGAALQGGVANRLLGSRVLTWAGRISYSVYLTHFLVLLVIGTVLERLDLVPTGFLHAALWLVAWAIIVGVGAATYYLVEEPGRVAIRRFADARATARQARKTPPEQSAGA